MSLNFYSFTDPADLDRYEVAWTQTQATASTKADQRAPEIPAEPNSSRLKGQADYGRLSGLMRHMLAEAGRPVSLREFCSTTGYAPTQAANIARHLLLRGSVERVRLGVYRWKG